MSGPKETIYDAEIAPLMSRIIGLCKAHKINMAATFALDPNHGGDCDEDCEDEPLYCTTVLPVDEDDKRGHRRVLECRSVMYPQPHFAAFTIITKPKDGG